MRLDRPPLNGDTSWKSGDLAECIYSGSWFGVGSNKPFPGPSYGEIRIVDAVTLCGVSNPDGTPILMLRFARYGKQRYESTVFRKIVPTADCAERGTATTIDDLRPARILEGADL